MKCLNRRTTLKILGSAGISLTLPHSLISAASDSAPLKFGVIADLHGGFVRDADRRLESFLNFVKQEKCDALIQLGDFAFPNDKHQRFAEKFNAAHESTIHVIGNHEFDYGLTRQDCYRAWGISNSYYTRDILGTKLIVLDGNEQGSPLYKEGYHSFVGDRQLDWLRKQLEQSDKPVVILSHQPLAGYAAIDNGLEVQDLLAKFQDKILLCMNGHTHIDSLIEVAGVRYLHVNSASYFWVGGKHRTAFYKEPLYMFVSIDVGKRKISIEGKRSSWKGMNPIEMNYFTTKQNPPAESSVVPAIRDREIL